MFGGYTGLPGRLTARNTPYITLFTGVEKAEGAEGHFEPTVYDAMVVYERGFRLRMPANRERFDLVWRERPNLVQHEGKIGIYSRFVWEEKAKAAA